MAIATQQPAVLSSREWRHDWTSFRLKDVLKEVEGKYLRDALRDAGGSVTKASRLLGFEHHQSFIYLLKTRHSDLLPERTPAKRRWKPLITKGSKHKSVPRPQEEGAP